MNPDPDTLLDLVRLYSPTGDEKSAVDYLVARMQELDFTRAFADEAGNAVGVMGEGPRQMVLLGHIDTVPGEIPIRLEGTGATPESPTQDLRTLYGRGSVDAKGSLAAFVEAVAAGGSIPGWQIVVIGAVGEEGDSHGARHVVPLYHPEFAIIGEPSRWDRVTLGYKGSAWAQVRVQRSLSHTAGAGESACEAVMRAWETTLAKVEAFNSGREKVFDRLQISVRGMDSGGDGFEEWASLRVGARLPLDQTPENWYTQLANDPDLSSIPGISIQPVGFPIPAYHGEKNTPLVRAFLAGIRAAGGQPGFVFKTGTADMNILAPAWNCPALAYGPGDSSLDHTPDEHLSLAEFWRSVQVLRAVLSTMCREN